MKKKIQLSCLCCFIISLAQAQVSYDVSLIPDSLKKNAHSVVREFHQEFIASSASKAVYKYHRVVTVLNEAGKDDMWFEAFSDWSIKLEVADIYVYDASGKQLQHIKQKDMSTDGYGEGLIDDATLTYFRVSAQSYPITVETNYTEDFKGMERLPDLVLGNVEHSIQKEDFVVTFPPNIPIRYKEHLIDLKPAVYDGGKDGKSYTWTVSGICAMPMEHGAPPDATPCIYISPSQFEYGGLAGDMSTWEGLGKWTYDLNKESYVLPEASKEFYRNMVAGATTDEAKARILYAYLQKNFRYVSIQLGVGGLKSFPATVTEKKKYGDCKALSTYMRACLDAVGVKSYTALINAGDGDAPVDPTFPIDHFDHVILCIPQPKDSIWLECTSNRNDFGILGAFTENRNALLLTENGGVLVHTPASTAAENIRVCSSQIKLSPDGSGSANVVSLTMGDEKLDEVNSLYEGTHDEQKRYLVEDLDFIQPDDFKVDLKSIDSPRTETNIQLNFEKIPEFTSGSKMFLNPRLYHIWPYRLPDAKNRTEDFCFPYTYMKSDTTYYQLPDGYVVDDLPKGLTLASPYASYRSSYQYDKDKKEVISYCTIELKALRVPAKEYASFKEFFNQVVEDETEKIVIDKP